MTHPIFAKLSSVRQALSAALDIANLENEINEVIEKLEEYDDNGDLIDSDECSALYDLKDSIDTISSELDKIETALLDLSTPEE